MKKTLFFAVFLSVLMISTVVSANFDITGSFDKSTVNQGDIVTLTINTANLNTGGGLKAFGATIEYDRTVFETLTVADFAGLNGFSGATYNDANGKFTVDNTSATLAGAVVTVKLKVKSNAALGNTNITIKDASASNGTNNFDATQSVIKQVTIAATSGTSNTTTNNIAIGNTSNVIANNSTNVNVSSLPKTGEAIAPVIATIAFIILAVISIIKYKAIKLD